MMLETMVVLDMVVSDMVVSDMVREPKQWYLGQECIGQDACSIGLRSLCYPSRQRNL